MSNPYLLGGGNVINSRISDNIAFIIEIKKRN